MNTRHLIIAGLSLSLSLLAGCSGNQSIEPIQTPEIEVPTTPVVSASSSKDITTETYISPFDDERRDLLKPTDKDSEDEKLKMSDTLSATKEYLDTLNPKQTEAMTELSPDIIAQLNTSTTPEQLAEAKEAMEKELEVIVDEQLVALNKQIEAEEKLAKKLAKEKAEKERLARASTNRTGAHLASVDSGTSGNEFDSQFFFYEEVESGDGISPTDYAQSNPDSTREPSQGNGEQSNEGDGSYEGEAGNAASEVVVKATFYDAMCDTGCIGITKTGVDVRNRTPNIIAVDPTVIPLHSLVELIIDGKSWGVYQAEDTGGAIKGNRIDILSPSRGQAFQDGVKHNVTVRILDKTSAEKKEAYQKLLAGN